MDESANQHEDLQTYLRTAYVNAIHLDLLAALGLLLLQMKREQQFLMIRIQYNRILYVAQLFTPNFSLVVLNLHQVASLDSTNNSGFRLHRYYTSESARSR